MPKKADGSLTGGTGDVNPQWWHLSVPTATITIPSAGSAAANVTQQFPVPVPKYPTSNGMAIVMEVLKIRWRNNITFNINSVGGQVIQTTGYLSTKAPPFGNAASPPFSSPADTSIFDINQGSLGYQWYNSGGYINVYRCAHIFNAVERSDIVSNRRIQRGQ